MKAKLYLDVRPNQLRKKGFPIVVSLNMKGKRKLVTLKHYVFAEDWDFEKEEPINNKRLLFFVRKKKLLLDEIIFNSESGNAIALEEAKNILLDQQPILESVSFYDFFKLFILELENKGKQGNAESYFDQNWNFQISTIIY